jgi:hypothetical protein
VLSHSRRLGPERRFPPPWSIEERQESFIVPDRIVMSQAQWPTSNWEMMRHPIGQAIRAVFFQTELEEYPHATHGGTLFIVSFFGRPYGVTCRHVFGDFSPDNLHVTPEFELKKGVMSARVQNLAYASKLRGWAIGSDLDDICIIEFADDLAPNFFKGTEYTIAERTVATATAGHDLFAYRLLKEKSRLLPEPDGIFAPCCLPARDRGGTSNDPLLRRASARFASGGFQSIVGMSGSPVFDITANALCGMVVRGGITANSYEYLYADIRHIVQLLLAVRNR